MSSNTSKPLPSPLPLELVTQRIVVLRGQRVIVDSQLAALYGVQTKRLNEALKRNAQRFPPDFMFELTQQEFASLRSQFATSSWDGAHAGHGGRRYLPRVFTEHGALMAATVLNSPRAVQVSVYVVRAFVELRELAYTHQALAQRLDALEQKTEALATQHDTLVGNMRFEFRQVFEALRELANKVTPAQSPPTPKRPIGFITPEDNKDAPKDVTKAARLGRGKRA